MKILKPVFSVLAVAVFSFPLMAQTMVEGKNATAEKIISTIIKNVGVTPYPKTVDVIKEGDPGTQVKGIITTMFATMDVLKEAVKTNCNLIIVHEPLYYGHLDQTEQIKNSPVFLEKKRFINEHNLVIWRFHDYIHSLKPDGIDAGMAIKLGWQDYIIKGHPNQFVLPETTLSDLLKHLKQVFPENSFYVIGKPDMKLSKVVLGAGAPGFMAHFSILENKDVDVLLAGESPQWETYEYMRDAVAQGRNKAVVFLGHIASEEAGMDWCATWLKTFIKDIPVHYVKSGPSFWSY
ncbi:MAG TPA: Nif3-like dinuclear metal center hexameric protein [Bacteroidales bacterium]|nr:Nif3-like dinuclear metal center hexameric protein [Bacteroidales bacterium]